jgi:hypothetical protein
MLWFLVSCSSLQYISHRELHCTVPPGTGLAKPVLVIQKGGEVSSSNLTLSYAECQPGSYQDGLGCRLCAPGKYAPATSALECATCEAGTWSAATLSARGASVCSNW